MPTRFPIRPAAGLVLAAVLLAATAAAAAPPCGPAVTRPGSSEGDHRRPGPLAEALAAGFRGVQVTVTFRDGGLLLGAAGESLDATRTLESRYLYPLQEMLKPCGLVLGDSTTFLLAIDLAAPTRDGQLELAGLLGRYRRLIQPKAGTPPVEFVLVGEQDAPAAVPAELARYVGFSWNCTVEAPAPPPGSEANWRLLSIDWRRAAGWDGEGKPTARARKLLRAAVDARDRMPGTRIRVHNLPLKTSLVRFLLDEGVDLIGVNDLEKGRTLL
jgi:hypothetical protein